MFEALFFPLETNTKPAKQAYYEYLRPSDPCGCIQGTSDEQQRTLGSLFRSVLLEPH